MTITCGSVCSGAGTGELAFGPLGVQPIWFSEIESAPSSVLAHHWPDVPNLGDMRALPERILDREVPAPDILMGGTPCQAFSVAGLRQSMNDARGNLTLTFCEIANAIDSIRRADGRPPLVILWENVPGVLSTKDNAFGCFLGALAGSGAAIPAPDGGWPNAGVVAGPTRRLAWRVLDAQYFGLAQRRQRVFVVAGAGDFRPESVLFEPASMRRDTPSRGGSGEGFTYEVAPCLRSSGIGIERTGETRGADCVVAVFGGNNTGGAIDVAPALNAKGGSLRMDFESEALCVTGNVTHALKAEGADASEDGTGRGTPIIVHGTQDPCISEIGHALGRNSGQENALYAGGAVRRLMPIECEKLQGLRPNHTLVPHRGKPMADGPRYKIIGNGWALNVVRWIAGRMVAEMTL